MIDSFKDLRDWFSFLEYESVEMLGGNCPVQGNFYNPKIDQLLYARARGSHASVELFPAPLTDGGLLPDCDPEWEAEIAAWDWPMAGYLEPDDFFYAIHWLLDGRLYEDF